MRVYVFVAIFVREVSFCFAVRLGETNCTVLDTNGREPLCTPAHKAYTIPNRALRNNVALVENEAHVDDNEKEARMQNIEPLEALMKPHLSGDTMKEMQEILNNALTMPTAHLDKNKIVGRSYDPRGMLQDMLARNRELRPNVIVEKWLEQVVHHKNFDQERDTISEKLLLALEELMQSQNAEELMSQVITVLETFRVQPKFKSFAENFERLIVVKRKYKVLVFQNWIKNINLENAFRILVGVGKITNHETPLLWVWFDYIQYEQAISEEDDLRLKLSYIIDFKRSNQCPGTVLLQGLTYKRTFIQLVEKIKSLNHVSKTFLEESPLSNTKTTFLL
ncbi:uncharacterized protein PHALS_01054 [Plasmopara halstedii]|uniref:RxLR-like protein n=1 Tax=Plasmopara halstedii TaxID=4781 RepID=A0A0P1ASA8_PLAHL|nr:uncharacterized protein PHALS_01054 [Plasmopara halstedii]CEG44710.1 hypothetical protein PHALS_01054 [Plasmopara halstedii]|eukprot:XP_024581079.1 hypothetical protein PHALS_01054 [Plasmopara halstedii]